MTQELDDGEFWLPSEFLTDDDLLTDFKTHDFKAKKTDEFSYAFGNNHFGFNSDLSSPVESVIGSTETESDEDDFITSLTQKIAQSTLLDSNKGFKLAGSPQSTLCGCKPSSGRVSPNCSSRITSPPEAVRWDLLYAAAGEVARMRMIEETTPFYTPRLFASPPKPSHASVTTGFYPNQTQAQTDVSYQQLQATQFLQMKQKQQQMMKIGHQIQNVRGNVGNLSTAAWPTLQQSQQQGGSGMIPVFLGETGVKKERTGTGVFLPRRFGNNTAETRKNPAGGSTVLLPDRVVHALNLNLDSVEAQTQARSNLNFSPEYDAAMKQRANLMMMAQQRRSIRPNPQPVMNQELRLPQEWTY